MKKLIKRLCLFFLPFLLGIIYLVWTPLDRSFAYHYVTDDCAGHGSWVYNRVFRNSRPVDVAFLGSSRTIHAPMDQLLEDRLHQQTGDSLHVLTLGYCRLGLNMRYVFLRDLLKQKEPKVIVLEVREDASRYSHPVFPYLAEAEDVFKPVIWFNQSVFKDAYLALETRFEYHKRKWLKITPPEYPFDPRPYGYGPSEVQADTNMLRQKKAERINRAARKLQETGRDFHLRFARKYLEKIHQLVEEQGIQLYFLYLPEYGWPLAEPMEIQTYQQYGQVWLPPKAILDNPENWMDDGHLNDRGAKAVTEWLMPLLAEAFSEK